MLSSKIDALLKFQPPSRELLQQSDIHTTAKRYYDFFGFSDNALVFLKRYVTENFSLLNYFDQSSILLTQTCHNFHSAWPKLHQDSSPLISTLLMQLQNILSLASSLTPLEFKVEDEAREQFSQKINTIKDIQVSIDKKFQSLWKQCHNQTAVYYQKLEEYKEQAEVVREKYDKYEKETRDFKGYNVTLVRNLEEKLNGKVLDLMKTKEAFEKVCGESQESYNALLSFFDTNRELLEEFLKLFLRTIIEVTIFLIERVQQNFAQLRQTTLDILLALKRLNLKTSWETEATFIKSFSLDQKQQIGQIKDINRINHHRQELVNAMGFLSQESMHLCQESIDKFVYFEEIHIFKEFFSQFDPKISANLLPLADMLMEFKNSFTSLFNSEKSTNEQIVHKIASQRFKAYSGLVAALSKTQQAQQMPVESSGSPVKNAVMEFLQSEEKLAKDYVKDLERLYTAMNQEVWNKMIQGCQKLLSFFREKTSEDKLALEVRRIQDNMVQALGTTETIENLESARRLSTQEGENCGEENITIADEMVDSNIGKLNKYNSGYKFIKEKKAESLAEYVRRQNEERLKEINPSPYTVEFEGKGSVSNSDDEPVLDSFACAFVEKMLLQGRIYITSAKIVFKSYFNGRTLFGSTVLYIPLKDIVLVEKKKNSLGIENMIEITSRRGTLVFTSFIFRDKAYDLMEKILTTMQPKYARNIKKNSSASPHVGESVEEELVENGQAENLAIPGESAADRKLKKQRRRELEYQKRNREILKVMPPLSKYETLGYKYTYSVDLNTFFRVFLCKSAVNYKGREYKSCWEIFEEIQGTYQIDVQDWNKELPHDITNKKNLLDYKGYLERYCIGRKRLNISIPFVPKEISFEQQNKLFFVNEKQVVVILEVETKEKIPLSDTFKFRTCYILNDETSADGEPVVSMNFNYYVDWYKSTMLKPVLLKAAAEEIRATGANIDKIIRELIDVGLFKKKKQELEASKQEEISIEDEEESEEVLGNGGNNVEIEEQEQMLVEEQKENVRVVEERVESVKQGGEFKVSKKILFVYFSVSLILISFIFMRQLLR